MIHKFNNNKTVLFLHLMLLIFSTGGVFGKLAAGEAFLSFRFCLYYGIVIAILGIYAIGWQQIIKRMSLTVAYANKAVTTGWGLLWGLLFFEEKLTVGKVLGAALVIIGVVLYSTDKEEAQ